MSAQMLEASLFGVGTVLPPSRKGCVANVMVKLLRQAANK